MITIIINNIDGIGFVLMPPCCVHTTHTPWAATLGWVWSSHGMAGPPYVGHLSLSILSALESHVLFGTALQMASGQRTSMSPFESRCCSNSKSTLSLRVMAPPLWNAAFHTKQKEDWGCQWMKYWYMVLGGCQGLTRVSLPLPALSFGDLPLSELRKWIGLPPVSRTPGH